MPQPSSAQPNSAATRTVRFSTVNSIKYIDRPTSEEVLDMWYSEDELGRFLRNLIRNVHQCTRLMISNMEQGTYLSGEERCKFIGLEHLLSRDLKEKMQSLVQIKRRHLFLVMIEQARQKYFQDPSADKLKDVSMMSSKPARKQAVQRGLVSVPALS